MDSLGKKRISFGDFEKLYVEESPIEDVFSKPFFDARKLFLELFHERQKIMEGHLGIALAYYYFAVLASQRRLEEVVINLMIACEALLITESDKICGPLSRRVATLIAKDQIDRRAILKQMREMYAIRSGIVHGRGKKPTFGEAKATVFLCSESRECCIISKSSFKGRIGDKTR